MSHIPGSTTQASVPKPSRQQQMYSSIISNAVRKTTLERIGNQLAAATPSGGAYSNAGSIRGAYGAKRVATVSSINDAKVSIGLSTSSSTRSGVDMPHLVPQRTNVLTGAST